LSQVSNENNRIVINNNNLGIDTESRRLTFTNNNFGSETAVVNNNNVDPMVHSITNNNFPARSASSNSVSINNNNNLEAEPNSVDKEEEPLTDDDSNEDKEKEDDGEDDDATESEESYFIEPICLKFSRRKLLIGYSILYRGHVIKTHIFPFFRLILSSRRFQTTNVETNKMAKLPILQNTFVNNNNVRNGPNGQLKSFSYPIVNRNNLLRNVFVNNN
jgi:hypothetical protein